MLKISFRRKNRGQIIVVLALVLVALLGFTALAIDSAMIYSDRRNAQNAADAAALAGAGMAAQYMENNQVRYDNFACSYSKVISAMNTGVTAAINRAATNSFIIDNNITDQNGVQVTCGVQNLGPYMDQYMDVKVMITADTATTFAHLFYNGPVKNTVTSIVRVHPRKNLGFGFAIAAMQTGCGATGISGTGNVNLTTTHGGIFSNSNITFVGNVNVDVNDPIGSGIRYVCGYSHTGNISVDPTPVQSPVVITPITLPAPDCASLPSQGNINLAGNNSLTINPGRYGSISLSGNSSLTFNPGLYCISNGMSLTGNQSLTGSEVTFYFAGGGFTSTGNSAVNLTAPTGDNPPAVTGMLMFASPTNTSTFTVTGNAGTTYTGTIYIPAGNVTAVGNSGMNAIKSQLVGASVTLTGNAAVVIDFDGALNYQIPATVDLTQ
jgi:Flp pilus assembly protein TadG